MNDQTITLLLRLVHILAGIFWVGAIFLIAGFLLPTMRATGREGGRFMQHLMQQRRLPIFLAIAMLLTVLSGFTLYGRLVSATHGAWAGTPPGIAYGVGDLAAILGALVGMAVSGSAARRMAAIGPACRSTGRTVRRGTGGDRAAPGANGARLASRGRLPRGRGNSDGDRALSLKAVSE